MKKYLVLFVSMALLLAFGCVEPIVKLGCCQKANATLEDGKCVLLNMTTSRLMEEYKKDTEWCNVTKGYCNVSIGGKYHLVPICTDNELNDCIDPDCTAMVCGDFMFKPKVAPGVIDTSSGDTVSAKVEVPPESEEEEETLGFYKAQCRFFPMDLKLASIMKNTKSSINVFRIGVGGSFDEYDNYRYYFPISDKYCNVNMGPSLGGDKVDRYMNYLGGFISDKHPYDPSDIGECMDLDSLAPEPPFRFGHDALLETPAGPVHTEKYEYKFTQYYKLLYSGEADVIHTPRGSMFSGTCSEERVESEPYRKLDREYYRKWLYWSHLEMIYDTAERAPFECAGPLECYSGSCSFDFYSRATNLRKIGEVTEELAADCNAYGTPGGKTIEVCAPTVNINPDASDPFSYASVIVNMAKIKIEVDPYDQQDIMEKDEPELTDCSVHDEWALGCVGDCSDMGGDHRCELRTEWCDFSGRLERGLPSTLKKYCRCKDNTNVLDYVITEEVVGPSFEIERMPASINIVEKAKKECKEFYGENDETDTAPCPVLEGSAYPPVGGFVFFGKSKRPEDEIKWNEKTVIGYTFGDYRFTLLSEGCNLRWGSPGETVVIGEPSGENWQKLMDAFAPMFEKRMDEIATEMGDGGGTIDDGELIISSMPWVLAYKREGWSNDKYTISSVAAQKLKERNLLDLPEANADGTSASELVTHSPSGNSDTNAYRTYFLMYPKTITLFFEPEGDTLVSCEYDRATGLPSLKQYGWCEPCTISTLAYQNITASDWAYIPMEEAKWPFIEGSEEDICDCVYELERSGLGFVVWHDFKCTAPHITDIDDYDGAIVSVTGAARTQPEASLMKERLGNYMKSGVLPVIDMTDDSNWDKTRPDDPDELYNEYDFERLFGDMGATIVIVDTIHASHWVPVPQERLDEISERAAIIRTHCWRCMTAVRLKTDVAAFTDERFNETIISLFSDPRLRKDVDIVAFDYSPQVVKYKGYYSDETLEEDVVGHLSRRGRSTLQLAQKPSLVLDFYTNADSAYWTGDKIEGVLRELADNQAELGDSGIMGIIWMPVRGETPVGGEGIVSIDGVGVGEKGEYFCSVQKGMDAFANPAPTVIYTKVDAVESVNCTRCSTYDRVTGKCNMICENGALCTLPEGLAEGDAKCLDGMVVEPCELCNATPGTFKCEYHYHNGTVEEVSFDSSDISSNLYMDVVGGLEKPNRCCLQGADGSFYSYTKRVFAGMRTVPVVFPKNGDEGASCGMGMSDITSGGFCGIEVVPMRNYDVNCEFIPS